MSKMEKLFTGEWTKLPPESGIHNLSTDNHVDQNLLQRGVYAKCFRRASQDLGKYIGFVR